MTQNQKLPRQLAAFTRERCFVKMAIFTIRPRQHYNFSHGRTFSYAHSLSVFVYTFFYSRIRFIASRNNLRLIHGVYEVFKDPALLDIAHVSNETNLTYQFLGLTYL